MSLIIQNCNKFIIKNWYLCFSFLYPFFLFLPITLGYKHFPYDFQGYNFPLIDSIYQEILNPESFLWDQYTYGGISLTSNPQTGLFYLPNLIFLIIHLIFKAENISSYWFGILGIFQYSIFCLFCAFLILEITKSKITSLIGSVQIFTLGAILSNVQHPGATGGFIFLPIIICLLLKLENKEEFNYYHYFFLIFALSSTISSGFYPQTASTILCIIIYLSIQFIYSKRKLFLILVFLSSLSFAILINSPVILSTLFDRSREIVLNDNWTFKNIYLEGFLNPFSNGLLSNFPKFDPTKSYTWSGFLFLPFLIAGYINIFTSRKSYLPLGITALITFFIGLNSVIWHSNLSSISSIFSILRGYNIVLVSIILNGFISTLGLNKFLLSKDKSEVYLFNTILSIFIFFTISLIINFYTIENFEGNESILIYFFLQLIIYTILIISINLRNNFKKIISSGIIIISPIIFVEKARFIMGSGPPLSKNLIKKIAGDKYIHEFLKDKNNQGLVAYDTRNIEGEFNGFWPSWSIRGASGFQPHLSAEWFKLGNKLSIHKTNRRFDFRKFDDSVYSDYSIKYYITRSLKDQHLDNNQTKLIYAGPHFSLYEIKDSLPLYRIRTISKSNIETKHFPISTNGFSKNKICLDPYNKYIFEAVGAYDDRWQAFFDGKKMKKFSTNIGIGEYQFPIINQKQCGEIKLEFFDKYFIYGLIIKFGTLSSFLIFLFRKKLVYLKNKLNKNFFNYENSIHKH